jgi:NagD protein
MFHRARRKLAEHALVDAAQVAMIGDTMETDIRGAVEAGLYGFLVLTGSTQLEAIGDYVYQPTRILQSVADLTEEIKTGQMSDRLNSPVFTHSGFHSGKAGTRHQTDLLALHKTRPRPAMTK